MQSTTTAIVGVNKIQPFLNKLFNRSQRVALMLVGDSTTVYSSHGWDHGIQRALIDLGLPRFGSGLMGVNNGDIGVQVGYGFQVDTIPGGNTGSTSGLPVEWRNYATNRASDTNHLGALVPWWIPSGLSATTPYLTANGMVVHTINAANFSNPYEGITGDLRFSMWHLITENTYSGTTGTCKTLVRKEANSNHTQWLMIENANVTGDTVAGLTFAIQVGLTSTAGITWSNNSATIGNRIVAALTAAGFSSISSPSFNSITGSYAIAGSWQSSINLPAMVLRTNSLSARYTAGGYGSGITSSTYTMTAGGNYTTLLAEQTITAHSRPITQPANSQPGTYIDRHDRFLGASASRDYPLNFAINPGSGATGVVYGPWASMFVAAAVSGSTSGWCNTVLCNLPSTSARVQAQRFQNQTDEFLGSVFHCLADHAGYSSAANLPVIVRIGGGVNDRNDTNTSVGAAATASNTSAGIADNWNAIINRIETMYSNYGWSTSNLHFVIVPSTPFDASDAQLNFARVAAENIANTRNRVASVNYWNMQPDFNNDVTALAAWQNDNSGSDYAHLSTNGFRTWGYYEWSSLQSAVNSYNALLERPGSVASTTGIWFAGKLMSQQEYSTLLQSFYPNLAR